MTLIKVDAPIGTTVILRDVNRDTLVTARVGADGVVREVSISRPAFEEGPYELLEVRRQEPATHCPNCNEIALVSDLQEYDPGEKVCWVCRNSLGRMDYYSGAGDW